MWINVAIARKPLISCLLIHLNGETIKSCSRNAVEKLRNKRKYEKMSVDKRNTYI